MLPKFFQFLDKFVSKDDVLIVAVSGGVDSVVLLDILNEYHCRGQTCLSPTMIVAHVNHNLRGKDSDADEKLVKKYAKKYGLQFESMKIEWHCGRGQACLPPTTDAIPNLEAKCRAKRYEFFEEIKNKHNAKYIVTAHHLNDNIETFFLNFIRGASLNGLCGMQISDGDMFRPLLNVTKDEILKYAKENELKWNEDSTNQDEDFARNRIRLNILPEIKKINPGFEKVFLNNVSNLREVSEFLSIQTPQPPLLRGLKSGSPLDKGDLFSVSDFRKLHIAQQKIFLVELYKKVNGSTYFLSSSHIDEILKMLNCGRGNLKKEFGKGRFIKVEKGFIRIV